MTYTPVTGEFITLMTSEHSLVFSDSVCVCMNVLCVFSSDYQVHYYEFTGVSSCWDVVYLYRLLWACVTLNVLCVFLGIITAAILGAFKDLVSEQLTISPIVSLVKRVKVYLRLQTPAAHSQMSSSPPPPPHIMYNPTQHMMAYGGFCPSGQTLPGYPSYSLPMQVRVSLLVHFAVL